MKSIEIRGLYTGYRDKHSEVIIGKRLDAWLESGRMTCLLGGNGAGKSTLMRTMSGFQKALKGEIYVMGRQIGTYEDEELARNIGVVLTEKPAVEEMKVEELVELGRAPYTGFWGGCDEADRKTILDAMTMVGIAELRERQIGTLSDGEKQKAMIAKTLAQGTPVIFLDEPTAFIDYPGKIELMRLLLRLAHEDGKTILISTHDLDIALRMTDDIWLLDKELGLKTGTSSELMTNGEVTRYFPILQST